MTNQSKEIVFVSSALWQFEESCDSMWAYAQTITPSHETRSSFFQVWTPIFSTCWRNGTFEILESCERNNGQPIGRTHVRLGFSLASISSTTDERRKYRHSSVIVCLVFSFIEPAATTKRRNLKKTKQKPGCPPLLPALLSAWPINVRFGILFTSFYWSTIYDKTQVSEKQVVFLFPSISIFIMRSCEGEEQSRNSIKT